MPKPVVEMTEDEVDFIVEESVELLNTISQMKDVTEEMLMTTVSASLANAYATGKLNKVVQERTGLSAFVKAGSDWKEGQE